MPAIDPNMLRGPKRHLTITDWGEFQTHVLHVAPSMYPIVSVVSLQGWKTRSRKADQSVKRTRAW